MAFSDYRFDMIKHTKENAIWGNYFKDEIFSSLLNSQEFNIYFINRFADLLNTLYKPNNVINLINAMQNLIAPDFEDHINRWNLIPSIIDWEKNVEDSREFARLRPQYQKQHILDEFNIDGIYKLTIETNDVNQGFIKLNSIEINNSTFGIDDDYQTWTGEYFNNIPVTLRAVALPGFKFLHWEKDGIIYSKSNELILSESESVNVKAIFINSNNKIGDIAKADYFIYPNPISNTATVISATLNPIDFKIYNLSGKIIKVGTIEASVFDISDIPSGIYMVEFIQDNIRSVKKVIKK